MGVEMAHQILSGKFLPNGVESTTELSPAQFARYVDDCRAWLDTIPVKTQDPDPAWREKAGTAA